MHARLCLAGCLALATTLAGCGSVPMTAITQNGHTFRGTLNRSIPSTFEISDGRVTCTGKFPVIVPGHTHSYTMPMACNQGLTGIVTFNDIENTSNGGGGILRLSDGTAGTFITGEGAAAL